jgi:polygalacturonase
MTVKNCTFDGTVSGPRLKADATQGGPVENMSYTNLTMRNVTCPIVSYSHYNKVGNPGAVSGDLQTTPEKVKSWNATTLTITPPAAQSPRRRNPIMQ